MAEHLHARRGTPAALPARRSPAGRPPTAGPLGSIGGVLSLQQLAGNGGVVRILGRRPIVQRQRVDLAAGGSVGEAPATNTREQVLTVLDRLHSVWSIPTDSYGTAYEAVKALPAGATVDAANSGMSLLLAALRQNEDGSLSAAVARTQLGIALSDAVGTGRTNRKTDILAIQDALHVEWHISNEDYARERTALAGVADDGSVADSLIPMTIAGIARLKRAIVAGTPSKKGGGSAGGGATAAPTGGSTAGGEPASPVSGTAFKYRKGVAGGYGVKESERGEIEGSSAAVAEIDKELVPLSAKKGKTDEEKARVKELGAERQRLSTLKARDEIEKTLARKGTTLEEWYGKIVEVSFLGVPIKNGVHELLATKLRAAEDDLLVKQGLKKEDLGLEAKQGTDGLRIPKLATGGKSVSLHSYGLAVDLNYANNPYIGLASVGNTRDVIKRATLLITGTETDALDKTQRSPSAGYDFLKPLSDAFKAYFALRGKPDDIAPRATALRDAGKDGRSDADWAAQIEKDYAGLRQRNADFETHDPANGFLDFDKRVVLALTGAGLTWLGAQAGMKDVMHFQLDGVMPR